VMLVWYVGLGFIGSLTPTGPRRSIARMPHRSGPQTRHPLGPHPVPACRSGPQTRHPLGPHPVPA
jgi:hypothetical protein